MFYPTTCVGLRYGPVRTQTRRAGFLGSLLLRRYRSPHAARVLSGLASRRFRRRNHWLPPFNALFRQCADVSLLRHRWRSSGRGCGILTACPSGVAFQRPLRSRLTPGRLASPGNPWSFGEGVSRPLCRYSCLHLLFHHLQPASRPTFADAGMLPYRSYIYRRIPRLRHRTYARLLSTRGRLTGELLRTL